MVHDGLEAVKLLFHVLNHWSVGSFRCSGTWRRNWTGSLFCVAGAWEDEADIQLWQDPTHHHPGGCGGGADPPAVAGHEGAQLPDTLHQPQQEQELMVIQLHADQLTRGGKQVDTNVILDWLRLSIELR